MAVEGRIRRRGHRWGGLRIRAANAASVFTATSLDWLWQLADIFVEDRNPMRRGHGTRFTASPYSMSLDREATNTFDLDTFRQILSGRIMMRELTR